MSSRLPSFLVMALIVGPYGFEEEPAPAPLRVAPAAQNSKIRLVPQGSSNPIPSIVELDFGVDANNQGFVTINAEAVAGGGAVVKVGGVATDAILSTHQPITVNWHTQTVYLDGAPVSATFYTGVNDDASSDPFMDFHVAIRENSQGYLMHLIDGRNVAKVLISTP